MIRFAMTLWLALGSTCLSAAAPVEKLGHSVRERDLATATLWIDSRASLGRRSEVSRALREIRGVERVHVMRGSPRVKVDYDASVCRPADLKRAVERTGHPAVLLK